LYSTLNSILAHFTPKRLSQQSSTNRWNWGICQQAKHVTGTVCEEWRANTNILPAGEFGDAYADSREVLGLSILYQAAYECLRDLGKS